MKTEKNPNNTLGKSGFRIEGAIRLEEGDCQPGAMKLNQWGQTRLIFSH